MSDPQRIVKLIPYGNREDNLFVELVVGGSDDLTKLHDFVGWHLKLYPGLTTDGSGQVTVTLEHAPASGIAGCFVMTAEPERYVRPVGLAGLVLTVEKREMKYMKTQPIPAGKIAHLPGGTSVALGAFDTGDTAPSATTTLTTATGAVVAGAGNALVSASAATAVDAHHHSVAELIDHGHDLTYVSTSLALVTGEGTTIAVLYH